MSETDLLILTLYIIGVGYVLYQAFRSVGEQVELKFAKDALNQQLADRQLQNIIDISFEIRPRYRLDDIRDLGIFIKNNSQTQSVYVEWDRSCLISLTGRSQRVVRLVPGMTFDVSYPQVFSVIAPGKTLIERFTTESVLQRPTDTSPLKLAAGLIIKPRPPALLPPSFKFFFRVVLQLSDPTTGLPLNQYHTLDCEFIVNRLPWTAGLPWNLRK